VKLREISGLIIVFRIQTHDRVLCRSCGTWLYREVQDSTLMKGWWGLFAFFANLWAIFANWRTSTRVAALQQPHDAERPEGPHDPGPLLRTRRGVKVAGILFAVLLALVVAGTFGSDDDYVNVDELPGKCVTLDPAGGDSIGYDTVECSEPHDATVISVADRVDQCSPNAERVLQLDMLRGPDRFACLDTD
jgi:hypothetical protein